MKLCYKYFMAPAAATEQQQQQQQRNGWGQSRDNNSSNHINITYFNAVFGSTPNRRFLILSILFLLFWYSVFGGFCC